MTPDRVREAMELAMPGRILRLDDEGNMSAQGVSEVIVSIKILAHEVERLQAELSATESMAQKGWRDRCERAEEENARLREVLINIEKDSHYIGAPLEMMRAMGDTARAALSHAPFDQKGGK